jgi:hypothetical protein
MKNMRRIAEYAKRMSGTAAPLVAVQRLVKQVMWLKTESMAMLMDDVCDAGKRSRWEHIDVTARYGFSQMYDGRTIDVCYYIGRGLDR